MDLILMRTINGFVPADTQTAEAMLRFKLGVPVRAKVTQMRGYVFHKKYFALLKVGFDIVSERHSGLMHKGEPVLPDFDRYRKDIAILSGFYNAVYNYRGECRLEAKSISFSNMGQEEFEKLYSKTIDVLLTKVIRDPNLSPEQLQEWAERVVQFA